MIVLICGDRNWTDKKAVDEFIVSLPPKSTIIHGNCRGADIIAGELGKMRRHDVVAVPAEWQRYGRAAGPIRNKRMLEKYKIELVVAFHDDLSQSRGTKDMIKQAKDWGIPVEVRGSSGKAIEK